MADKKILSTLLFDVSEYNEGVEKRYYVNLRRTVLILPITENNEVYLVSQYRRLLEKNTLEIPAGFIEEGEDPETAAKRELAEETGLTAAKWIKLLEVDITAGVIGGKEHIFLAQDLLHGKQNLQDEEDITIVKVPLTEAIKKIKSGEINTAGSIAGIFLVNQFLKDNEGV